MGLPVVSVERVVAAAPQPIFDLLADPARHCEIDGSGTVGASRVGNPTRLALGATFGIDMRIGAPYRITNTVVEFDEGSRIAWRHFGGHVWRYVLTPVDGGTLVREEWDPTPVGSMTQLGLRLTRFPQRNKEAIEATLERLASTVEAPAA